MKSNLQFPPLNVKMFFVLALAISGLACPVSAQSTSPDQSTAPAQTKPITAEQYGVILNLSGRQRMLTQKVSKELLQAALNVDKDASLASAKETAALFDRTLNGLKAGDTELHLPPTTNARIRRQLDRVESLWTPFQSLIHKAVESGQVTSEQVAEIARMNGPLLDEMNKAVKLYENQAGNSALKSDKGLAVAINLSGKQRMLTQKMSKEFFLIALKQDVADNKLNLLETLSLFDRTLTGLRNGDSMLQLEPTTDPTALARLSEVDKLWAPFKPQVAAAADASSTSVNAGQIQAVAQDNLPLLKAMNAAVTRYEELAAKN